jgi:hypothetical protein
MLRYERRLRLVISSFEAALGQLRSTITQLLQSFPTQPPGDCDVPPYQLLIDLGSDSRRRSLSPFSSQAFASIIPSLGAVGGKGQKGKNNVCASLGATGGVYFEIETYVVQHSVKTAPSVSAVLTAPATPSTLKSDSQRSKNHTSSSSSGSSRRRHRGTVGIIVDAGHFEYLIEACRTSGADRRSDVIAMGMRIKIDALTSFLLKSEEKKMEAEERNRKARKNKHSDKEKVQESSSNQATSSCADSRLDAFLSKRVFAAPDIVVALSNVNRFGEGQSMRSAGAHTPAGQTTSDVATPFTHQLLAQPHNLSSSHSSMMTVTLSQLRALGYKAIESDLFLKNRTFDSPISKLSAESITDFLFAQCYHARVPFLVLLDDKVKPAVGHNIGDTDKELNQFSVLKKSPVKVQFPSKLPSFTSLICPFLLSTLIQQLFFS